MRKKLSVAISTHRRASVLILVVVLCVLLALMGTALLTTTQADRYVAAQNSANTETDLLMEGVKQIAISTITDTNNRFSSTDWNWDMPYVADGIPTTPTHDLWLSPRLPEGITSGGAVNWIAWPTLGILPTLAHFDDPNPGGKTYGIRDTTTPHSRPAFNTALSWQIGGNNPGAADADGDGIADSGFFVLPVGAVDGVTYYAALRIIDNNSAVNVNTALSATTDYDFNGAAVDALGTATATAGNLGAFRSHVGLAEMLHDYNHEFAAIVKYRNNNVAAPTATAYDNTGAPINGVTFITQGDMYDHMLADRLLNPGCPDSSKTLFNPFLTSDAQALAHHFILPDPGGSKSSLESTLYNSGAATFDSVYQSSMNIASLTLNSIAKGRKAYPAGSYVQWFDENFNYDGRPGSGLSRGTTIPRPIRPLLTTYNPVSNQIVPRYLPTPANPPLTLPATEMEPYRSSSTTPSGAAIKTNINTASFGELYRAFWCVMADNLATTGTPYPLAVDPATDVNGGVYRGMKFVGAIPDATAVPNPQRMFRSSIRDPRATGANVMRFSNAEQLKLRAAAAATQAIYLRDHTKTSQTVQLTAQGSAAGPVNVKLFPTGGNKDAAQPFIVEVFAWYEKNAVPPPPRGNGPPQAPAYVAIKLYNPFPVPVTLDASWQIRAFKRTSAMYKPPFSDGNFGAAVTLPFAGTPVTIPPNGVLVIDNFDSAGLMSNRPVSSGLDPTTPPGSLDGSIYQYMSITGLNAVLNNEMIITQDVDGPGATVANTKPIDSFDFTGFDPNALTGLAWHYERPYGTTDFPDRRWMCVYPGRYDGSLATLRHQGIEQSDPWNKASGTSDPWTTPHGHLANNASIKTPTYPSLFSIQLTNQDWPGPNAGAGKFPFGGFARNGDILQVPFIAAYTISNLGGQVIDMNSISMDAAFAEDSDPSDDYPNFNSSSMGTIPPNDVPGEQREQIGRFCPIRIQNTLTKTVLVDDYETDSTKVSYDVAGATPEVWHYRWARSLFDYLTVQSPASDYLPNDWSAIKNGTAKPVQNDPSYPAADESNFNSNDIPTQNNVGGEDTVGVQGLININTAPWKVLAAIPWVPKGQPSLLSTHIPPLSWDSQPPGTDDNDMIAQAIVRWRDGDLSPGKSVDAHGPFKSIFDLYAVTAVDGSTGVPFYVLQTLQQVMMITSDPGVAQGDFSPNTLGTTDQVRYDFEEQTLLLTKVSNLLTTRSDTFTVYILLQGWRGVGGSKPTKVVERRAAMIVDRTPATKDNPAKINRWDLSND